MQNNCPSLLRPACAPVCVFGVAGEGCRGQRAWWNGGTTPALHKWARYGRARGLELMSEWAVSLAQFGAPGGAGRRRKASDGARHLTPSIQTVNCHVWRSRMALNRGVRSKTAGQLPLAAGGPLDQRFTDLCSNSHL